MGGGDETGAAAGQGRGGRLGDEGCRRRLVWSAGRAACERLAWAERGRTVEWYTAGAAQIASTLVAYGLAVTPDSSG